MSFLLDTFESRVDHRRAWVGAIALGLLQTGIILYMIVSHALILMHGTEVLLKAAPVDPRDLLRGDYVVLNYDISRIPVSSLVGEKPKVDGSETLYVRLEKQADGYWAAAESSFQPLSEKTDTVVLKSLPFDYRPAIDTESIRVGYGIESYYVPEGEGHHLEQATSAGRVGMAVRVGSSGTAQIRSLLLDGQQVYDEPLY